MGMPPAVGQRETQSMALTGHGYYTHELPQAIRNLPSNVLREIPAARGAGRIGDYDRAAANAARAYGEVLQHRAEGHMDPQDLAELVGMHQQAGRRRMERADRQIQKLYAAHRNALTQGATATESLIPWNWTEDKRPPNIHPEPIDYSHLPGYSSVTGKRKRKPTG